MKNFLSILTIAALFGTGAHAAVVGYTDEASWTNDAGGSLTSEGFDGFAADVNFAASPVDVGDFTVNYNGRLQLAAFNFIDALPASAVLNLLGSNALIGGVQPGESITLFFDQAITSFSAHFAYLNFKVDGSFFEVLGTTFQLAQNSTPSIEFFGVVSDVAFTEFTIAGLPGREGFAMDDLKYGVAAIPVPGSVALLAGGLLLLGGFGRRRRS